MVLVDLPAVVLLGCDPVVVPAVVLLGFDAVVVPAVVLLGVQLRVAQIRGATLAVNYNLGKSKVD